MCVADRHFVHCGSNVGRTICVGYAHPLLGQNFESGVSWDCWNVVTISLSSIVNVLVKRDLALYCAHSGCSFGYCLLLHNRTPLVGAI